MSSDSSSDRNAKARRNQPGPSGIGKKKQRPYDKKRHRGENGNARGPDWSRRPANVLENGGHRLSKTLARGGHRQSTVFGRNGVNEGYKPTDSGLQRIFQILQNPTGSKRMRPPSDDDKETPRPSPPKKVRRKQQKPPLPECLEPNEDSDVELLNVSKSKSHRSEWDTSTSGENNSKRPRPRVFDLNFKPSIEEYAEFVNVVFDNTKPGWQFIKKENVSEATLLAQDLVGKMALFGAEDDPDTEPTGSFGGSVEQNQGFNLFDDPFEGIGIESNSTEPPFNLFMQQSPWRPLDEESDHQPMSVFDESVSTVTGYFMESPLRPFEEENFLQPPSPFAPSSPYKSSAPSSHSRFSRLESDPFGFGESPTVTFNAFDDDSRFGEESESPSNTGIYQWLAASSSHAQILPVGTSKFPPVRRQLFQRH